MLTQGFTLGCDGGAPLALIRASGSSGQPLLISDQF
jgi:hypothetical protein